MLKNKKNVYLAIIIVILIAVLSGLLFLNNKKNYTLDNVKWNDINYVFDIDVPEDFDEYKIERLNGKIEAAKLAYQDKPDDNWTWVMIGNMYQFVGDHERALAVFYKASEITPDDISSILNIATIHEKYIIDYDQSEKYYSKAITIFPQMPDLHDRLAKLYWHKMDRLDDAETTYLQGLDQGAGQADSFLDLINFYDQTNQLDKKLVYVKQLLVAYPNEQLYIDDFGHLLK
jgi:tetratricopeptide (TPR) repeat protein